MGRRAGKMAESSTPTLVGRRVSLNELAVCVRVCECVCACMCASGGENE